MQRGLGLQVLILEVIYITEIVLHLSPYGLIDVFLLTLHEFRFAIFLSIFLR
jgi:hypothetical protein